MSEFDYKNVLIERGDGITWVVLNRPEKRNAMSPELHYEMDDALARLADDRETRVLILTGAGEAWCAGQDLRLYFRGTENDPAERRRASTASHSWRWERLSEFPRPTIAMVNGFCFGGGFTQLCAVDFVITAEDATFGLSEVNWGIIPGGVVSWNLADMLLPRHALYYAVTGETFDGKRAVEIGLANVAVPADRLRETTVAFARKLLALNPGVVRHTKEAIRAVRGMTVTQARDYLRSKQDSLARADGEIREQVGMRQFLDDKTYRPGFGPYRRPS
ncbi:MAG TPA: p-hydroxycinnamoyl CoA hydratase/lyase [Stellaceae bacterium]|nr:p-hydroxycinnamoyl CoA hydratase/lyase [Stellaceae bacterium]